jgi:aldose 1-epimerase
MNRLFNSVAAFLGVMLLSAIARSEVVEDHFGTMPDGTPVQRWIITNTNRASVSVMSYGATIVSLKMPDRRGTLDDIVLGYDQFEPYLTRSPYFGAVVGRYANRIAGARFTLDGVEYKLTANNGRNILHGGQRGFDKVVWTGAAIDNRSVEFTYLSKDGEQGFPGNLTAHVRYTLSDSNGLKIEYSATTDKDTVVNLTNHSYFNLAGQGNGDILKQELTIDADQFTPTDVRLIPTGDFLAVSNSPFDFRQPHPIGQRIDADDDQAGYDVNFVLTKQDGIRHAASVYDPTSGRAMDVWTNQPGLQFYSGQGLDGSIIGKGDKTYPKFGAFCLEPQHFPDSPNEPGFPSTELKLGETYRAMTEYRFTTQPAATTEPAPPPGISLTTGWTLIKEGETDGLVEQDAHHASNPSPHLLRIAITKTAAPGLGRVGAISAIPLAVNLDQWFDIRFSAINERGSVGMVFSLETADGKVLTRTTLPEIGQGRGRRATTMPTLTWRKYHVALHARAADPNAHLVLTPIEPAIFWIDNMTITPR